MDMRDRPPSTRPPPSVRASELPPLGRASEMSSQFEAGDLTDQQPFATDMARTLNELGVAGLRTTVIDLDTMLHQAGWGYHQGPDNPDSGFDQPLESAFPGASAAIARVEASESHEPVVQRMSPRRWVMAWRVDESRMVMALVHFHQSHITLEPHEVATIRLVADAGLHADQVAAPASAPTPRRTELAWPQVERRRRVVPRWIAWPAASLACVAALLGGWMTAVAVPQARQDAVVRQADLDRLRAMADSTVTRSMATAMASGDYGEVQAALSSFAALGYFEKAVVTNARQRVVASVGELSGVRIGDAPPADLVQQAQASDLMQGSETNGRLFIQRPALYAAAQHRVSTLQGLAALAMLCAGAAAAMVVARWPSRQRSTPRARASGSAKPNGRS